MDFRPGVEGGTRHQMGCRGPPELGLSGGLSEGSIFGPILGVFWTPKSGIWDPGSEIWTGGSEIWTGGSEIWTGGSGIWDPRSGSGDPKSGVWGPQK